MSVDVNGWLVAGGLASGTAALAHLACIFGGPAWYRAMGAGERVTAAVARGDLRPHLMTLAIAAILATWTFYALSGAGLVGRLPLLRPLLGGIAAAYLLRAAALPLLLRTMRDRTPTFLVTSSLIVFVIGAIHAIGWWRMD